MLVIEYAPPSDPADGLLDYPFRQPGHSYLTDGHNVESLPDTYSDFERAADSYLAEHYLPRLSERVPVVAYGANSSPARLQAKMAAYGPAELQPNLQTVPQILATVPDASIVWHGTTGEKGSIFAELYRGADTEGKMAHCFVQFMTAEQVALLHATEGITYHMVDLPVFVGVDSHPLTAKAYVAGHSNILLKDGQPVEVQRPGAESRDSAMTAWQAVSYILSQVVERAGANTTDAHEFVTGLQGKPLEQRKAQQGLIAKALAALGLSRDFGFPGSIDSYYGRAGFDDLFGGHDGVYQLAETTLQALRPAGNTGAKDDILAIIRTRATAELAKRTR